MQPYLLPMQPYLLPFYRLLPPPSYCDFKGTVDFILNNSQVKEWHFWIYTTVPLWKVWSFFQVRFWKLSTDLKLHARAFNFPYTFFIPQTHCVNKTFLHFFLPISSPYPSCLSPLRIVPSYLHPYPSFLSPSLSFLPFSSPYPSFLSPLRILYPIIFIYFTSFFLLLER